MSYFSQVKVVDPTSGTAVAVNSAGQMKVVLDGVVDSNNSSTTPLAGGATFTGTATEVLDYAVVSICVYSDVASATDGLSVQQSSDGTNWYFTDDFTIQAATGKTFTIQAGCRYMRVVYTNGGSAQAAFTLSTVLKKTLIKPSSHRIADSIVSDDDAELVTNVNKAETPSGTFVNIGATASGNLKVANVEDGLAIAKGIVTGHEAYNKFGAAPDFDFADGEVTIWDGAEDGTAWENMAYDYSSTADIDSVSSSNQLNDVGLSIVVEGLDASYNFVSQTVTLDATDARTRVALSTSLIRVFRAYNDNSTNLTGHVVVYPNTALTAGVPTDKSKIRAVIQPENNQTEMAIFTVPAGKTAYLRSFYCGTGGASRSTEYIVRIKARREGKVFRLRHKTAIIEQGTSYFIHKYEDPPSFVAKTDIEMTVQLASAAIAASFVGGFDLVLVDD